MDLSKLSDDDFKALQAGRLDAMSDAGFGVLIAAQQASKSAPEKQAQAQQIAAEKYNPTNDMSTFDKVAAGAGKSVYDVGRGISQLAGGMSRADVDETKRLDAPLMATRAGRVGNVLGDMAVMAPTALIPGANSVTGAFLTGGLTGAAQPVGTEDSRMTNALYGSGGSALGMAAAKGVSRVMAPRPPQGTEALSDAGINLTLGQRMGGGWKRAEDALTSLPVVGDVIKNAQRRSFEDFNSAVANRALSPINQKIPAGVTGRDAVAYVEKAIGQKYDNALAGIQSVKGDSQFGNEIMNLQTMVHNSPLPAEVQQQFDMVIKNQIANKLQGQNVMTAQTYKDAESELGRLATKYGADPSADKQLLGDAIEEAQAAMRRMLERSAGPQYAQEVAAANKAWAEFKRMQKASTFLGAEDGVFTPENYLNAVKSLDKSKDKSSFARGNALGQDLGDDAKRVMGSKVPDSGTPFRTAVRNPVTAVASGVPAGLLSLKYAGPYSETGQALYNALMTSKRPNSVRLTGQQLDALAPYLGAIGGANALANRPGQ